MKRLPLDDPTVKLLADKMRGPSKRFCDAQAKLYSRGPGGREPEVTSLVSDIQSARGSRFVERMLTTIETCRLQKRNVFEYLTGAVEAHLAKRPAPSLLPAV